MNSGSVIFKNFLLSFILRNMITFRAVMPRLANYIRISSTHPICHVQCGKAGLLHGLESTVQTHKFFCHRPQIPSHTKQP